MSGLEAAASVAAIISAFSVLRSVVKDIAEARRNRRLSRQTAQEAAERRFITTLQEGETEIGTQYNQSLARLGSMAPAFQQGDSKI
jgi:hypothetical protein